MLHVDENLMVQRTSGLLLFNVTESVSWFKIWFWICVKFLNLSYNGKYFGQKDSKPWQVLQASQMTYPYIANM